MPTITTPVQTSCRDHRRGAAKLKPQEPGQRHLDPPGRRAKNKKKMRLLPTVYCFTRHASSGASLRAAAISFPRKKVPDVAPVDGRDQKQQISVRVAESSPESRVAERHPID